jgi:hypothetical protein
VKKYLSFVLLLLASVTLIPSAIAQKKSASTKDDIEYEAITDDPYDLNKMWLHFYPIVGDAFLTNMNAGFGMQANYLMKNKFDFRLAGRIAYSKGSDVSRGIGAKTSDVDNKLLSFTYVEGGATYHLIDKADQGEAKVIIYTKRYSEGKWASTVPEFMMVPAKVRKIVGIRGGGLFWHSATNLGDVLKKQNIYLQSADGTQLARTVPTSDGGEREQKIYTNVSSTAIYLGGSLGRIRNVVVKPKKYDIAVHDVIMTTYADLIYSPSITIDDIQQASIMYSTAPVKKNPFGFRLGFEGMYNREFSWSYGAEVGVRPSIQGRSMYINVKVGFAFASRLDQKRQAYQKEQ